MTGNHEVSWHNHLKQAAVHTPLPVTIRGACMAPLMMDGAVVKVAAKTVYWPGDIVVALSVDGAYLAHRVLGFGWHAGRWMYLTRADNSARADAALPARSILGQVCGGDCDPKVTKVPLGTRCVACYRFLPVALVRVFRRRWHGCLAAGRT